MVATTSFHLPPCMAIETVESIAADIAKLPLGNMPSLTLDGAKVESITSPGVQILLALHKTFSTTGRKLNIANPSGNLSRALADLGVDKLLIS